MTWIQGHWENLGVASLKCYPTGSSRPLRNHNLRIPRKNFLLTLRSMNSVALCWKSSRYWIWIIAIDSTFSKALGFAYRRKSSKMAGSLSNNWRAWPPQAMAKNNRESKSTGLPRFSAPKERRSLTRLNQLAIDWGIIRPAMRFAMKSC